MTNTTQESSPDSDDPFARMSRADKTFNFAAATIDAIGWPLGAAFFSITTILPVYLRHLHASNALVGLLNSLLGLLILLPGLFLVRTMRAQTHAKPWLFVVALAERFALLPLAFLTPLWGIAHPQWLVVVLFVCFSVHGVTMGLNQPAYWVVIGKTIPPRWRGRLYGFAGGIAGIVGIGLDWVMRNVVFSGANDGFPDGYGRGFLIGFTVLLVSVIPLGLMREPPQKVHDAEDAPPHIWHETQRLWQTDAGFRRLLLSQIAVMFTNLATPFFVLHAQENLHATGGDIARYTTVVIFAGSFGALLWGAMGDHRGNRDALLLAAGCNLLCAVLSLVATDPLVFVGVFVLNALAGAGFGLSGNNLMMEFAGDSRRIPLYVAVYNAVIALPRAAAPLLGGVLADSLGYRPLFVILLVLAAVTFWLILRIPEPRQAQSRYAKQ